LLADCLPDQRSIAFHQMDSASHTAPPQSAIDRVLLEVQLQRSKELERQPWPGGQSYSIQSDTELPFQPGFVTQLLNRFGQASGAGCGSQNGTAALPTMSSAPAQTGAAKQQHNLVVTKNQSKQTDITPVQQPAQSVISTTPAASKSSEAATNKKANQTESFVPIPSDVSLPIKNIVQNVRSIFEANPTEHQKVADNKDGGHLNSNKSDLKIMQRNEPTIIRANKTSTTPSILQQAKASFSHSTGSAKPTIVSQATASPEESKKLATHSPRNHSGPNDTRSLDQAKETIGQSIYVASGSSQTSENRSSQLSKSVSQAGVKDPVRQMEISSSGAFPDSLRNLMKPSVLSSNATSNLSRDDSIKKGITAIRRDYADKSDRSSVSKTQQINSIRPKDSVRHSVPAGHNFSAQKSEYTKRATSVSSVSAAVIKDEMKSDPRRQSSSIRFVSSDSSDGKVSQRSSASIIYTEPVKTKNNGRYQLEDQVRPVRKRPESIRQSGSLASVKPAASQLSRSHLNQDSGSSGQFKTWSSIALQRQPTAASPASNNTHKRPSSVVVVQREEKQSFLADAAVHKGIGMRPSSIEVVQQQKNNKTPPITNATAPKSSSKRQSSVDTTLRNAGVAKVDSTSRARRVPLSSTELASIRRAGKSWYFFAESTDEAAVKLGIPDCVTPVRVGQCVKSPVNKPQLFSLGNKVDSESADEHSWLAQSTVWDHIRSAEAHGHLDSRADPQLAEEAQRLLAEAKAETPTEHSKVTGAEVRRKKLAFASEASLEQTFVYQSDQSILEHRQQALQQPNQMPEAVPLSSPLASIANYQTGLINNADKFVWGANIGAASPVTAASAGPPLADKKANDSLLASDPSEAWSAANSADLLF
ncbi:hypothetical protein BOX15_Mlig007873g1, partial [Macrostomum lignano]